MISLAYGLSLVVNVISDYKSEQNEPKTKTYVTKREGGRDGPN